MKINFPSRSQGLGLAILVMSGAACLAAPVDLGTLRDQLKSVSRPELPAKAANLVLVAQGSDRAETAAAVVGTAVEVNPVAAPVIVSSVAKLSPDMAAVAATAAAAREPKQLGLIARSAAGAAPAQAAQIAGALAKAQPKQYRAIAMAVSETVPGVDRSVLVAVVEAVPGLKPFYVRATQAFASENSWKPSTGAFMDQMALDMAGSAKALNTTSDILLANGVSPEQQSSLPSPPAPPPPPVVRPPFQPLDGVPGEIGRKQTKVLPPGGPRDYSAP